MTDTGSTDPDLTRLRETARAYAEAVRQTQRFFDRVTDLDDPSVQAEYATFLRQEDAARSDRLDAIEAIGMQVASIDGGE